MARPAQYPEWASDGDNITEPSSGRKAEGWLTSQRPPAQYFNWFKNLVYQWIVYLSPAARQAEQTALCTLRGFFLGTDGFSDITYDPATGAIVVVGGNGVIYCAGNKDTAFAAALAGSSYTDDFNGVAWDPVLGQFAAVGDAEEIQTDSNGLGTWTRRVNGATNLNAVASSGAGTFVAVGDAALIRSCVAIATWTSRTSAIAAHDINDVTFGAGLFVAVGEAGSIQTSPDGVTWTARTSGASGDYTQVSYVMGQGFVAVHSTGATYSEDGITWADAGNPASIRVLLLPEQAFTFTVSPGAACAAMGYYDPSDLAAADFTLPLIVPGSINRARCIDRTIFACGLSSGSGAAWISPRIAD